MKQEEKNQNFTKEQDETGRNLYDSDENKADFLQESLAAYDVNEKRQGEYTVEDYRNWSQDERVELIDGEIIRMEAPKTNHQRVLVRFSAQICNYIDEKNGNCEPFISPIDVQLDKDEKTMLQPDFIIVCDPEKVKDWGIFGAPDFVLEVLSPSTRSYDMLRKKNKYISAGVKEYWILDLEKEILITYVQANGYVSAIYPLQGKVGVALYNNNLEINLDAIRNSLYRE